MIPNRLFLDRLGWHEKQFLGGFDDPDTMRRFFMLEWHRRAHKTTLAINLLIRECCRYPKSKYVYIAPTQVWAREVVWDDPTMLWDALPDKAEMGWKPNEQKLLIKFANGSMLKIGGSDKPDSLRGIDADGAVLDEWALHKKETWTQIFRPIIAGPAKPGHKRRWAIFLYTPKGPNHATQMFDIAACVESEAELPIRGKAKKFKEGWWVSRLSADESGIIERIELDKMLQEIEDGTLTQAEYDQEMLCRRVTDEERTLITSILLEKLKARNWESMNAVKTEDRKIVAIDPAFGGDMCCMKAFINNRVEDERIVHHKLTSEVVYEAKLLAKQIETKNFIVDCIGNGKGVADGLEVDAMEYDVQYFNSSARVEDSDMFANLKAQAVYYAATQVRKCLVEPVKDLETRRQLVALSRYKVNSSGRMLMMSNDDVKVILGCSPDKGLAWIYGIWGLQYVEPEIISERAYRQEREIRRSAMAM